uniref:CSON014068 protein n=1 Tax=Culicoides sonorensis TaxID=179676 RepID=A0A336M9P2_CULSO
MQFPYMKVAIYVLTFAGYCYSGFGSGMLTTLRDSIIAAEAVFGDCFHNLIVAAKKFTFLNEVFDKAIEENCVYKCPEGTIPVKNKLHTPSFDGCGSLGLKIDTEYLPSKAMEDCCNEHDVCYDTCNSDKELCDLDFKRCLYKYCDAYEKSVAGGVMVKGCKAAAKMLFAGTLTLGCKSYLDSQERACYCPPGKGDFSKDKKKENPKPKKPANYGWKNGNDL